MRARGQKHGVAVTLRGDARNNGPGESRDGSLGGSWDGGSGRCCNRAGLGLGS